MWVNSVSIPDDGKAWEYLMANFALSERMRVFLRSATDSSAYIPKYSKIERNASSHNEQSVTKKKESLEETAKTHALDDMVFSDISVPSGNCDKLRKKEIRRIDNEFEITEKMRDSLLSDKRKITSDLEDSNRSTKKRKIE